MNVLTGTPDHAIVWIHPIAVYEGPFRSLALAGFIHPICRLGLPQNVDLLLAGKMGAA
jgi:hypothetical protein